MVHSVQFITSRGPVKASCFETATRFYTLGIGSIPVKLQQKFPNIGSWLEYQTRLPTTGELITWFSKPGNVGIVTGWQNLVVIDFDSQNVFRSWQMWAAKQGRMSAANNVLRHAYKVNTARGVHVYLETAQPEKNKHLPGVDIKARGGYVLGAGSIHPTGVVYEAQGTSLILPHVEALSDVLPASLLLQVQQPAHVVMSSPILSTNDDPWALADNPPPITAHLVDHIKQTLRIENLLVDTEQTSHDGRWLRCRCPLHEDDNPSFWIDTARQICGCFGGCTNKPLDVVNLYARLYGLTNTEAIYALRRLI